MQCGLDREPFAQQEGCTGPQLAPVGTSVPSPTLVSAICHRGRRFDNTHSIHANLRPKPTTRRAGASSRGCSPSMQGALFPAACRHCHYCPCFLDECATKSRLPHLTPSPRSKTEQRKSTAGATARPPATAIGSILRCTAFALSAPSAQLEADQSGNTLRDYLYNSLVWAEV